MTTDSALFLDRLCDEPMLLDPRAARRFASSIEALFTNHEELAKFTEFAGSSEDFWDDEGLAWVRPYSVSDDGILSIPVAGVLLNKFPYQLRSYATGYEYIAEAIKRGVADNNVKGIALIIDSPGGMVAGNFELVDFIYSQRSEKPIRAFANDSAYSAAYSIASAAEEISVTKSGGVGSIGVLTMHVSYEKMLDNEGIEVTFIYAGKHKVEGNSYQKLSEAARERTQARIDKLYNIFTFTVSRNRDIKDSDVKATEALTYDAEEAISIGLADSVGSFAEEFSRFSNEITEGFSMSQQAAKVETGVSQEQHDQAVASAHSAGMQEGLAQGAKQERSRVTAILSSPQAANRKQSASAVALRSDMTVEQATEFLASLPEEKDEKPATVSVNHFEKAMSKDNPEVGSAQAVSAEAVDPVSNIKAAYKTATGR